jgi:hypothetical protein
VTCPSFCPTDAVSHPHSYGRGLSEIRAAAAGVGGFSLLAVLVYVTDEYPTTHAGVGAQALEAGVVRFYSVPVILGGWVRMGCARLSLVSPVSNSFCGPGPGEWATPAGPFLYPTSSV